MRRSVLVLGCLLLAGCGESKPTGISATKRAECEQLVAQTYQEINRLNAELEVLDVEVATQIFTEPPQMMLSINGAPATPVEVRPKRVSGVILADAGAPSDDKQPRPADRDVRQVEMTERRIKIMETEQALYDLERALAKDLPEALEAARKRLTSK